MIRILTALALFLSSGAISFFAFLALANPAFADARSASLVNSFQVMCMLEPISFAALDAKAQAMKLPVRQDLRTPTNASGHFSRSKSWLLPLKTGAHEFVVSEARGLNGDVVGCGIGAADARTDEMKQDLTKALALGKPASESTAPDGKMRVTTWQLKSGPRDETLVLADGTPTNSPGIYLTFLQVIRPGR